MSGLEHSLQVRRISLSERQLLGEGCEWYSPGHHSFFAGDFEKSVEPAGDWVGEGEIVDSGKRDSVTRGNVRTDKRSNRDVGVTGLRCRQDGKQRELLAFGQPAPRDGDRGEYGEASF